MPVIESNDSSLKKVLGQKQPALLMLYRGDEKNKPLHDALKREAKKNDGDLLVISVDVNENPNTHGKYGDPMTPALITMTPAFFGRKIKSTAESIRPADIRAHIDYLLNDTPLPEEKPEEIEEKKGKKAVHITQQTFRKDVLKSKTPVLVDFWAVWCGPCQTIAPFVDNMARKYSGQVKVVKVNVDENPALSQQFGIQSIPTFIMFEGGQPVSRLAGANPNAIETIIQETIEP